MKFKINRDHFSSGIQLVMSVVGTRKTMPILQNVLIEAKEGLVWLTTTNLDLGAKCSIKAEVSEEGTITLPVKELGRNYQRTCGYGSQVETSETPKATISTRGSIFNVIGMDSKEFPPLPELEEKKEFSFDREELISMLKSVSYAQSVNEERYMLKGVFFQILDGKLSLVATDGRRLAVTNNHVETKDEGEFILPSLSVNEIEKLPDVGNKIKISFTDRQVAFELSVEKGEDSTGFQNSIYLISKVVEGKYPNYKQVIPKDDFNAATIERELMQECVHRAALVSDEKVTLRIKEEAMEITGLSTLGDACESMSISYKGNDAMVSFNPRFILDPLRSITKDKIILEFRDDMSPGVFKINNDNGETSFLCVVMPIRTD